MTVPSWAILVPTIPRRTASFVKLMDALLPQLEDIERPRTVNRTDWQSVAVIAWLNDGTVPGGLAGIRDELLRYADLAGFEYVSFVDDDDMVPAYYVHEIRNALRLKPDHVGFPIQYYKDGRLKQAYVEHSLKWKMWGINRTARGHADLVRDFTHIDPIRTEHARRGTFLGGPPHSAEDRRWVRQVRPHLKTEVFIDKIMYQYFWSPAESSWDAPGKVGQTGQRDVKLARSISSPHLFWHPESL